MRPTVHGCDSPTHAGPRWRPESKQVLHAGHEARTAEVGGYGRRMFRSAAAIRVISCARRRPAAHVGDTRTRCGCDDIPVQWVAACQMLMTAAMGRPWASRPVPPQRSRWLHRPVSFSCGGEDAETVPFCAVCWCPRAADCINPGFTAIAKKRVRGVEDFVKGEVLRALIYQPPYPPNMRQSGIELGGPPGREGRKNSFFPAVVLDWNARCRSSITP